MKTLLQWYREDWSAWILVLLAVVFAVLPGLVGIAGLIGTGLVICARLLYWSRGLPLILCALMVAQPAQAAPEPQGVGVAMGIVVGVIGGVVVYKTVRWCQQFSTKTNVIDRMKQADSASLYYGSGSCLADIPQEHVIQLICVDGALSVYVPEVGLFNAGEIPLGVHHYSNGQEIDPGQSRIHFAAGAVHVDPVERTYILERSTNLEFWEPVLEINQPDMPWTLEDTFEGDRIYYRVK